MRYGFAACLAMLLSGACGQAPGPAPVRVAAAASLADAFESLAVAFRAESGHEVVFSFGSSGFLAKQIREGAPFDVFASADTAAVDSVIAAGVADSSTRAVYARGRIAVWCRKGGVEPPATLAELLDDRFTRISLAQPEHAPYGAAGREALMAVRVWDELAPRVVYAENVRQTLQFAQTGNVDAAVVALSLVVNDRENPWLPIAEKLHQPLRQALAVCTGGKNREGGAAFARFVLSEKGRAAMQRFGYSAPDAS